MKLISRATRADLVKAVCDELKESKARWLIVPSYNHELAWRRDLSIQSPELCFGLGITTFSEWTRDLWGIFGDGRVVISPTNRLASMAKALELSNSEVKEEGRLTALGNIETLAEAIRVASGIPSFEAKLKHAPKNISARLTTAWLCLKRYRELIDEDALIDEGSALELLGEMPRVLNDGIVCVDFDEALPSERAFMHKAKVVLAVEENPSPAFDGTRRFVEKDLGFELTHSTYPAETSESELAELTRHLFLPGEPIQAQGMLRFALASGHYAQDLAICKEVERMIEKGAQAQDIFVVCKQLSERYNACAQKLEHKGIASTGTISRTLARTPLGQALAALITLAALKREDGSALPGIAYVDALSAFALMPASGIERSLAHKLGLRWRRSAHMRAERAWEKTIDVLKDSNASKDMLEAAQSIEQLIILTEKASWKELIDKLVVNALPSLTQEERLIHKQAEGRIRSLAEASLRTECSFEQMFSLLSKESIQVRVSLGEAQPNHNRVHFITLEEAATLPMPYAIFAELSSDNYPVSRDDSYAVRMVADTDLDASNHLLETQRLKLYRAVRNVSCELVVSRALTSFDNKELRASALFEELCDCYNPDPSDYRQLDSISLVPQAIPESYRSVYSEDDVVSLLPDSLSTIASSVPRPFEPLGWDAYETPNTYLSQAQNGLEIIVDDKGTTKKKGVSLYSASSIESYINCPFSWFISKRLNPKEADTKTFLPTAQGLVVHRAMELFYKERMVKEVSKRITEEEVSGDDPKKEKALRSAFETAFQKAYEQQQNDPDSPLLLLTKADKSSYAALKRKAFELLKKDAGVWPADYRPYAFEFSFGGKDSSIPPVEYAGHAFKGSIDRIDICLPEGKEIKDLTAIEVIISDYKGRILKGESNKKLGYEKGYYTPTHFTSKDDFQLPTHPQLFIYARLAERALAYKFKSEFGDDFNAKIYVRAAFYRSYRGDDMCGAYNADVPALRYFDQGFEKAEGFDEGSFEELLSYTEGAIKGAFEQMEKGNFKTLPYSTASCDYCLVKAFCPEERTGQSKDSEQVFSVWEVSE